MNNKFLILAFFLLTFLGKVSAQDFHHAVGLGINFSYVKSSVQIKDFNGNVIQEMNSSATSMVPALIYVPRLNFSLSKKTSFSILSYMNLGMQIESNSRSGTSSGSYFTAGIPIYGQMNWGLDSQVKKAKKGTGFFLGAGYDIGISMVSGSSTFGHGPSLITGMKFIAQSKVVGLALNFTYPINKVEGFDSYVNIIGGAKAFMKL